MSIADQLASTLQSTFDRLQWAIQFLDAGGDFEKGAPWPEATEWLRYAKEATAEAREKRAAHQATKPQP